MKIIIFTASTGGGHKRAAAAIEAKIKAVSPDTKVKVIDAMKTIGRVYDKTVCDGYHFMATKIPKVYGKFYKITDRRTLMYKAVMQSNTMMSAKLLDTINEYKPDAIIMCHPFVTTMVSKLRRQHKIDVKAISLITDYDAHRTYIVPYVDAYVLAEPDMATKLIDEYGVDKSIIYPLGIPIFDRFTEPFDKKAICEREGLDPNKPTILLMAGSFGVTSNEAQADLALQNVYDKLNTEYGAILMDPPYHAHAFEGALAVIYNAGTKENAGIFSQSQGWIILAEALRGHGERAFNYFIENAPAAQNNRAEIRRLEPYCYGQFTEGKHSPNFGRSHVHWLTGTASTVMVGCVEGILGMRPDFYGLKIAPSVPKEWEEFEIEKDFRGSHLHIVVKNPGHAESGCEKLFVNGEQMKDNYIPQEKLTKTTEVELFLS